MLHPVSCITLLALWRLAHIKGASSPGSLFSCPAAKLCGIVNHRALPSCSRGKPTEMAVENITLETSGPLLSTMCVCYMHVAARHQHWVLPPYFDLSTFIYLPTYTHHVTHVAVRGQLREVILSFHYMGFKNWTQVFRLGYKHLYSSSHLTCLILWGRISHWT